MVDIKGLTGKLNQLRVNNQDKIYVRKQLLEDLRNIGFSNQIAGAVLTLVPSIKEGKHSLYQFSKEPIHFSKISEIYQRFQNYKKKYKAKKIEHPVPVFDKAEAIKQLQAAGYQIRKCIGFDEARFKSENPELYKKYLIYENL